ncbi:MAG: molybdate ABC transporter substrate-binding protein [SAR202 cluster bacterium]|nr:molybdate ABC transporter substrate-binding protein [SAR202 cluster bacterium]MQG57880.1 molybdate ABC transporter substrate-binding protein [SAR202 cluster bacterium]
MNGSPPIKIGVGLTLVCVLLLGVGCGDSKGGAQEAIVFAAASLKPALTEVGSLFESDVGGSVLVSTGGSQSLARQIAAGAPADVFIPAGEAPVEFLTAEGVEFDDVVRLFGNRLVIVAKEGAPMPKSVADLTEDVFERVAIADPALAPAGAYARQALEGEGVWDAIRGKSVIGSDVRVTMAYVQSGNADAAMVYATDALVADGLVVNDVVASDSHAAVVYPAVILASSQSVDTARRFVEYLRLPKAGEVFAKFGFIPLAP